jgi:hypothetical protein
MLIRADFVNGLLRITGGRCASAEEIVSKLCFGLAWQRFVSRFGVDMI